VSESTENPNAVTGLELAEGRVIEMLFAGRPYRWTFRPVTRSDWEKFFQAFESETVQMAGEQIETFEIETGLVELARTCVQSVDGYKLPESGDFRPMLPRGHLKAFGLALRDVTVSKISNNEPIALTELHEISIDCTWSLGPDGKMVRWSELKHRFNAPSLKQMRAFNRASNTFRIIGDDRGGRTRYPAKQPLMMDFYDELIHSVDLSYSFHGEPLQDRQAIVRHMDAAHKVAAVQGFLNAGGSGRIATPARTEEDVIQ
jgi:hypothetical protein